MARAAIAETGEAGVDATFESTGRGSDIDAAIASAGMMGVLPAMRPVAGGLSLA
ncbi:MAG: hypothetical protein AAFY22_14315 [Pseudomonadota bacterium]